VVLTPLVLGPADVPLITDPEQARSNPELTVMSAMAHGAGSEQLSVFTALGAALDQVDPHHANLHTDLVYAALPTAVRHRLVVLMATSTSPYLSDFARRYDNEGEAHHVATAVFSVLRVRGIDVPDAVREKITGCADLESLERWLERAVTIATIDELFA
jgi:hypothetical protein